MRKMSKRGKRWLIFGLVSAVSLGVGIGSIVFMQNTLKKIKNPQDFLNPDKEEIKKLTEVDFNEVPQNNNGGYVERIFTGTKTGLSDKFEDSEGNWTINQEEAKKELLKRRFVWSPNNVLTEEQLKDKIIIDSVYVSSLNETWKDTGTRYYWISFSIEDYYENGEILHSSGNQKAIVYGFENKLDPLEQI